MKNNSKKNNSKNNTKQKSWVERKLSQPKFRQKFKEEIEKLAIGEQLIKLRIAAHLTQAQLARKIGTTASAISRYENATYNRYELNTLRRITEACGGRFQIVLEPTTKKAV